MSLGFIILLIVIFGYISNWLNWRYLNYKITHYLYYIGAFVHESSHALLCILTGAKITGFKVFVSQPHVTHGKSKLFFIGNLLISSAPIFGGLLFLFLVNHLVLGDFFSFNSINITDWQSVLSGPLGLITQMNPIHWQSWVMLFLLINVGAMLGPSFQDIKNIWLTLIVLFFIQSSVLENIGLIALNLILVNIMIQAVVVLIIKVTSYIRRKVSGTGGIRTLEAR